MELHTGHHLINQLFGMNVNMDKLYMTVLKPAIVGTVQGNTGSEVGTGRVGPSDYVPVYSGRQ